MTWRTEEKRPAWLPLLLTFLLGLLIGWWVIGWWIWPPSYGDPLPHELRPAEREQYLTMVADSYATNNDLATAQRRTGDWPKAQLSEDLSTLRSRLASEGQPAEADHVQRLAMGLGITAQGLLPGQQPGQAQQPDQAPAQGQQAGQAPGQAAAQPTTQSNQQPAAAPAAASAPSALRQICTGALWLVLFLLAVGVVIYLWNRFRGAQGEGGPVLDRVLRRQPAGSSPRTPADDIARQTKAEWVDLGDQDEETLNATPRGARIYDTQPSVQDEPVQAVVTPRAPQPAAPPAQQPASTAAQNAPVPPASGVEARLGEFVAVYRAGEPDYDEAFDILDAAGNLIGQCGLSLNTPVGRSNDQAAALQVWLWDAKDNRTHTTALMSENAYRDTALRGQLAGENPALPVRQGTEFDLDAYRLVLHGTIDRLAYADVEPIRGIFSEVAVRLRVSQKG